MLRTQDIPVMTEADFYRLDPDHVTPPEGRIPMSRTVFGSLVALRVHLVVLIGLVGYRFAEYAHFIK